MNLAIVKYCALECERQRSGERSVWWMARAWEYASERWAFGPPDLADVLALGRLVEPEKNKGGLRQCGVRVGYNVKMDYNLVPRALDGLLSAVGVLEPDEWYRQYEEIHPFVDGNGRTGSLLWNWLRRTLEAPEDPPDFWKEGHESDYEKHMEQEMLDLARRWREEEDA